MCQVTCAGHAVVRLKGGIFVSCFRPTSKLQASHLEGPRQRNMAGTSPGGSKVEIPLRTPASSVVLEGLPEKPQNPSSPFLFACGPAHHVPTRRSVSENRTSLSRMLELHLSCLFLLRHIAMTPSNQISRNALNAWPLISVFPAALKSKLEHF